MVTGQIPYLKNSPNTNRKSCWKGESEQRRVSSSQTVLSKQSHLPSHNLRRSTHSPVVHLWGGRLLRGGGPGGGGGAS